MKALAAAALIWSSAVFAGPAPVVDLKLDQAGVQSAGTLNLSFDLIHDSKPVTDADLEVEHEKKLHFFAFDPSLTEFRHLHPDFVDGKWRVSTDLAVNGQYWLYAQGILDTNHGAFITSARMEVAGGEPAHVVAALGEHRKASVQGSIATLTNTVFHAGKMTMPNLDISREDGSAPVITPYLGAAAHIAAVSADGTQFVHVHPMGAATSPSMMLHLTFPKAGEYRLWVQFMDGGILKTAALSVNVLP